MTSPEQSVATIAVNAAIAGIDAIVSRMTASEIEATERAVSALLSRVSRSHAAFVEAARAEAHREIERRRAGGAPAEPTTPAQRLDPKADR